LFVHCFLGRSFIWSVSIEQMSIIVNGTKGPVLGVLRLRQPRDRLPVQLR
jgi:hypothetical protein